MSSRILGVLVMFLLLLLIGSLKAKAQDSHWSGIQWQLSEPHPAILDRPRWVELPGYLVFPGLGLPTNHALDNRVQWELLRRGLTQELGHSRVVPFGLRGSHQPSVSLNRSPPLGLVFPEFGRNLELEVDILRVQPEHVGDILCAGQPTYHGIPCIK